MRDFRQLDVWHEAHQLTLAIYQNTVGFPKDEIYGLTSQLRRSSASIAANIAEGCGRDSTRDFVRFLTVAAGSAVETEYHLLLAKDLTYIGKDDYVSLDERTQSVKRMLTGLIKRIRRDEPT